MPGIAQHFARFFSQLQAQINLTHRCELEEQHQHICGFVLNASTRAQILERTQRLIVLHLAEVIHQLTGFNCNCHREIFWIVKLLPITLRRKRESRGLQACDVRGAFSVLGLVLRAHRCMLVTVATPDVNPACIDYSLKGQDQKPPSAKHDANAVRKGKLL